MRLDNLTYNNWVLVQAGNDFEPHRIKGIIEDEAIIENGEAIPKECMRPLPITEEILALNNVKYVFDGGYTFVFYDTKSRYCSADGLCFVHELQNTMKVAGLINWPNEFKIK